jgi:hypothetical protein
MQGGQDAIMLDLLGDDRVRKSVPKHVLSLLFLAPAVWRNAELIRQFVALGADVNVASGPGLTPLMLAAHFAAPDVLRFLLAQGARAGQWSPQGEMALHRAALAQPRVEMLEKMRILIDAGEGLHERAPHSALPDHILAAATRLQTPMDELLKQGDPRASILQNMLGALAQVPDLLSTPPVPPPADRYFAQFQRTAADVLAELRKDSAALAELESYAAVRWPGTSNSTAS